MCISSGVRFQYRASKATSNLKKHRVSFADSEGVFWPCIRKTPTPKARSAWLPWGQGARDRRWWWFTRFVATTSGSSPLVARRAVRYASMRAEYDFSGAKRGALLSGQGKTRITIYIDNAVLDEFRARAEQAGTG